MNDSLRNRIIEDLEKSGFASEMKAMHAFAQRGWHCDGSATYFDRDQNQTREIDLVANHWLRDRWGSDRYFASWFFIVAQVKKTDKPWVVFRQSIYDHRSHIPEELRELDRLDAWVNLVAADLPQSWKEALVGPLSQHSLLSDLGWRCYGVHEFEKKPDDKSRWYGAFVTAAKAADEELEKHMRPRGVGPETNENRLAFPLHLNFIQPLVILDGALISADLMDDGKIVLAEVGEAPTRFCFRSEAYNRPYYRVDLVRLDRLACYLERCESRHKALHAGINRLGLAENLR